MLTVKLKYINVIQMLIKVALIWQIAQIDKYFKNNLILLK